MNDTTGSGVKLFNGVNETLKWRRKSYLLYDTKTNRKTVFDALKI